MTVFRKILGILLLIIAPFLVLATIVSALGLLKDIPEDTAEKWGYFFGSLVFLALMGLLIYFTIKKALQLLKNKPQDDIEEIGQS